VIGCALGLFGGNYLAGHLDEEYVVSRRSWILRIFTQHERLGRDGSVSLVFWTASIRMSFRPEIYHLNRAIVLSIRSSVKHYITLQSNNGMLISTGMCLNKNSNIVTVISIIG